MSMNNLEWNLRAINIWYCEHGSNTWTNKARLRSSTTNNIILTHVGSYLIVKYNNEAIETLTIPIAGQPGALTVTVFSEPGRVLLESDDEIQDRSLGLTFAAVQNCKRFICHLKRFMPIMYAEFDPECTSVQVSHEEQMHGQPPIDGFPDPECTSVSQEFEEHMDGQHGFPDPECTSVQVSQEFEEHMDGQPPVDSFPDPECTSVSQEFEEHMDGQHGFPDPVRTTVYVRQAFEELMNGEPPVDGFPAGDFLLPGLSVAEAFASVLEHPSFPETMAAIHECFERLNN